MEAGADSREVNQVGSCRTGKRVPNQARLAGLSELTHDVLVFGISLQGKIPHTLTLGPGSPTTRLMSTEAKLRCLNMKQHAQIFVSSMCACIVHTDDFGRCAVVVVPRLAVLCWLVPITAAAAKFVWRQAGL